MTSSIYSGMPQMRAAFSGWTRRIVLARHTETVVDGVVTIQQVPVVFNGTIQPLNPRELALKPEGQRSWTWLQIHCLSSITTLVPGDRITWEGAVYKVMAQNDYGLNNYIEYHIVKDFQGGDCAC